MIVSAYHLQVNGIIKYGHKPIIKIFSKISDERSINLIEKLAAVL